MTKKELKLLILDLQENAVECLKVNDLKGFQTFSAEAKKASDLLKK